MRLGSVQGEGDDVYRFGVYPSDHMGGVGPPIHHLSSGIMTSNPTPRNKPQEYEHQRYDYEMCQGRDRDISGAPRDQQLSHLTAWIRFTVTSPRIHEMSSVIGNPARIP